MGSSEATHHTWVLGQQMSRAEGFTLTPLNSDLKKTLDAALPLIGAPEQVSALGPAPRDFSRLSPGSKIGARDQWD